MVVLRFLALEKAAKQMKKLWIMCTKRARVKRLRCVYVDDDDDDDGDNKMKNRTFESSLRLTGSET